ncbi:MAG: DUF4178 domain-containing protein [Nibricoccus sp.]
MNTANPTALRIGMSGSLFDRTYKICGRVVLYTEVDGERYAWNEFFLKATNGEEATLVFEEDENGPSWRFFQYFEPQEPFTANQVARVSLGDRIQVDDFSGIVDFVGNSTVALIEGEAPEGVERGDRSNYFNAKSDTTLVVSWLGGEIEHYIGQTITRQMVKNAFHAELPASYNMTRAFSSASSDSGSGSGNGVGKIITGLVIALFFAFQFTRCVPISCSRGEPSGPRTPPPAVFSVGRSVTVAGQRCSVRSVSIVEYATETFTRRARLYDVADETGTLGQLLQGTENDASKWIWWSGAASEAVSDFSPQQLAAMKPPSTFSRHGQLHTVSTLFRLRFLRCTEGTPTERNGKMRYGFIAKNDSGWTVFIWDELSARAISQIVLPAAPQ